MASSSTQSQVQATLDAVKTWITNKNLQDELANLPPLNSITTADRSINDKFYGRLVLIGTHNTNTASGAPIARQVWATVQAKGIAGKSPNMELFVDNPQNTATGGLAFFTFWPYDGMDAMGDRMLQPFRDIWRATAQWNLVDSKNARDLRRGLFKSLVYWYFLNHAVEVESQNPGAPAETFNFENTVKDYLVRCLKELKKAREIEGQEPDERGADQEEEEEYYQGQDAEEDWTPAQDAEGDADSDIDVDNFTAGQDQPVLAEEPVVHGLGASAIEHEVYDPTQDWHEVYNLTQYNLTQYNLTQYNFTQYELEETGQEGEDQEEAESAIPEAPAASVAAAPQQAARLPPIRLSPEIANYSASDTVPTLHIDPDLVNPFGPENEPTNPRVRALWDLERQRRRRDGF